MMTLKERLSAMVGRVVETRLGCTYAVHAIAHGPCGWTVLAESLDGGECRPFWCHGDAWSDCVVVA